MSTETRHWVEGKPDRDSDLYCRLSKATRKETWIPLYGPFSERLAKQQIRSIMAQEDGDPIAFKREGLDQFEDFRIGEAIVQPAGKKRLRPIDLPEVVIPAAKKPSQRSKEAPQRPSKPASQEIVVRVPKRNKKVRK